jgi:hypothetical protein
VEQLNLGIEVRQDVGEWWSTALLPNVFYSVRRHEIQTVAKTL